MGPDETTVELLKSIRDEVRGTNTRVDTTNSRLDAALVRLESLDVRLDRLERRQNEAEVRLSTELVAVVSAIHEVRDAVISGLDVRHRVDDHEVRLRALEGG